MAAQDEVVIDLQNYKDRVGTRVVPGRYRVRVDDAELDQTRDGAPMINVWLVVAEGEFEGATVIDRLLPQHPKALFRVVGFMQAIGLQTPKKRLRVNITSWVGKVLEVDIEDGEPYNGRVKSEVRGYYRIERKASAAASDLADIPDAEDIAAAAAGEEAPVVSGPRTEAAKANPGDDPSLGADDGSYEPIDLDEVDLS